MTDENGHVYTVPVGLTVHCIKCGVTLGPGSQCWIEDSESSSIYCLKHAPRTRQAAGAGVATVRRVRVPRRKAAGEW